MSLSCHQETLEQEVKGLEGRVSAIQQLLGDLKVQLYAKFGDNINLEADESWALKWTMTAAPSRTFFFLFFCLNAALRSVPCRVCQTSGWAACVCPPCHSFTHTVVLLATQLKVFRGNEVTKIHIQHVELIGLWFDNDSFMSIRNWVERSHMGVFKAGFIC